MSRQKGILMISSLDLWPIGKEKGTPIIWYTLKGYAERGWQIYFIAENRAQPGGTNAVPGVHVVYFNASCLKRLLGIKKIGFFARVLWWLRFQVRAFLEAQKIHRRHNIDIVYSWDVHAVPVTRFLANLWRVPMVSRFLGTSLGSWLDKRFWKLRVWENILGLTTPADLVIMTNDGTQGDKVLQQLGVDMRRVRFWLNGVDWDLFRSMPQSKQAKELLGVINRRILLCISRLVSWKRVDRSINALPGIVKQYPDVILMIVGDGPERQRLEQLALRLGVREHVRFEGAVPHSEIPKYLAAADIFLSFYDLSNVGNPLLEAMMAGKCIVTLNNGDTGRFIKSGENGVLLEYEDLPKLPEVIKELLANEALRRRLGVNARKFAEETFWSWEKRIEAEVAEVGKLIDQ